MNVPFKPDNQNAMLQKILVTVLYRIHITIVID